MEDTIPSLTETKTKNLLLRVRELADLYALKTLYDYLAQKRVEGSLDTGVFFCGSIDSERSREVLQDVQTRAQCPTDSIDAIVGCYSDIGGGGNLEIDISILKNCVDPMRDEDKIRLRQKYGVDSQEPVVVIGYASPSTGVEKLVEAVSTYATVYLVGDGRKQDYNLSPKAKTKVHVVNKHGVLKDYYAMADAAINANNLWRSSSPLHNFVEATEGGPLFMVPSANTAQYGYRQLVTAGVIVECADLVDLVSRVEDSLRNFNGNTRVVEARTRHLTQSREKYLPVISAKIMQLMGVDYSLPDSDLIITLHGSTVRVMHPDSNWGSIQNSSSSNLERKNCFKTARPHTVPPLRIVDILRRYLSFINGDLKFIPSKIKSFGTICAEIQRHEKGRFRYGDMFPERLYPRNLFLEKNMKKFEQVRFSDDSVFKLEEIK